MFDLNHCVVYVMILMLIAIAILYHYNHVFLKRERFNNTTLNEQNSRLALVLRTGRLRVWKYVLANRHYYFLSEEGSMEQEYNPIEFSQFFDQNDYENLRAAIYDICEGKEKTTTITLLSNAKDGDYRRHYEISLSVSEHDEHGRVLSVIGIQHDVTEEHRRIEYVNQLLMRYHTVFNTSLVDMIYYDHEGVLRDINERACEAFGVKDRDFVLNNNFLLKNNPMFGDVEIPDLESTRTSAIVDFAHYKDPRYHLDKFGLKGKMYYESTINPIRTPEGELDGIFMAGRNITEMVESYHRQQEGAEHLRKATERIRQYVQNINYALRVSDIRLLNYYPKSATLELSDNIDVSQLRFSQLRCIRLASPRFRRTVSSMLNRMDHLVRSNIDATLELEIYDKQRRKVWMMFNLVPIMDSDGKVERYFGMCRDITDLVETEQRLAVETQKAQETERLKQAFLTNMSYEIRTPLNNVVGFAGLLNIEHDEKDEASFIEQIKIGTNHMLQLVNDVLYLSQLDANMVEYTMEDVDFTQIFESRCQMGWSNLSADVKILIDNPYESLVLHIDAEHVGYVIQKICQLSSMFITQGRITARCEYRRGELIIGIEDTGEGVDEETASHVFERFVRDKQERLIGTGIDLPIVQKLVQQMGGSIEFDSKIGHGSSMWISIPCEAKVIERRHNDSISNIYENIFL